MTMTWLVLQLILATGLLKPFSHQPQRQATLEDVRFMTGCWEGTFRNRSGHGVIEEHYTAPTENTMLGTTRFIREGRTVQYEFTLIRADTSGIRLVPYPNGQRSEHDFVLTKSAVDQAVFEAPEHDYPKRIIYRKDGETGLHARIDGGADDRDGREWYLRKASCF